MEIDVNIKELYEKGINIQKYFKEIKGTKENDIDSILYSYDFQAGSYTREYFDEEVMKDKWILNGRIVDMTRRQVVELRSQYIAEELKTLQELNLNVIRNELFPISSRDNNTAITIIEKERGKIDTQTTGDSVYACPKCKKGLKRHREAYYCPECFSLYPVFHNIPVLNPDNAVLCSKYESDDCFLNGRGRNEA